MIILTNMIMCFTCIPITSVIHVELIFLSHLEKANNLSVGNEFASIMLAIQTLGSQGLFTCPPCHLSSLQLSPFF